MAANHDDRDPLDAEGTPDLPRDVAPDDIDLDDADLGYGFDDEKDAIASLIGDDDSALSAEEAALHITDLTDDAD